VATNLNAEYLDLPAVIRLLTEQIDYEGGIHRWAYNRDIHPSVVDHTLSGRNKPTPQLLAALGLERIMLYRRRSQHAR
jgi:hypothetical protein